MTLLQLFAGSVLLAAAAAVAAATTLGSSAPAAPAPTSPRKTAQAFLATLSPPQHQKATEPFESDNRADWNFVPRARRGLPLLEMDANQKAAADALLRSCLSRDGYQKVSAIRTLDDILRAQENDSAGRVRNSGLYHVTVFGDPAAPNTLWGWRYEGHHVSLNWTLQGDVIVSSSPQSLGANPASVGESDRLLPAGTRTLAGLEDRARDLVRALSPEQRARAVSALDAPDLLTSAPRQVSLRPEAHAVAYQNLDEPGRAALLALVCEYARVQTPAVADARLDRIRKAGLDTITFAWQGDTAPDRPHHYRVQGPTFLIEYDNTQNNGRHIHSVWRDFAGDFGRDVIPMGR